MGAQWLGGRVLDLSPRGCGFEPHRRHCVVSLMGCKESNQTNKHLSNGARSLVVYASNQGYIKLAYVIFLKSYELTHMLWVLKRTVSLREFF